MMIDQDIIFLDCTFENSIELLGSISDELYSKGYVKDSFKKSIIERERIYPTAVKLEKYGIAVPHTDAEHILKPGIAFVRINKSCKFKEMCTNEDVKVNMVFVLLVKDKEKQVPILTKLMGLFSKNRLLDEIYKERNPILIERTLNEEIK